MLVSVIIPTFNRENTVLGAVESALSQTYTDLEVIVVDDGSTDGTTDALKSVADRIVLIKQANAGPSAARNRGVAAAKGGIVAFLDSDDHWKNDKIERQALLMQRAGPGMCCCVCNASVMGFSGEPIGHTFDFAGLDVDFKEGEWTNPQDVLATRFLLFNQVVAIRREAFDRVGGFNPALRLLEDYELSLRLSTAGSWGVISDPLVIKYNDTNGIGVECMMNREKHAKVHAEVISGILAESAGLGPAARTNLQRTLDELATESKALELLNRKSLLSKSAGHSLEMMLRLRRAFRRRGPAWPGFKGRPLPTGT